MVRSFLCRVEGCGGLLDDDPNGRIHCLAGENVRHALADIRQQAGGPGKAQSVGRLSRRFVGQVKK